MICFVPISFRDDVQSRYVISFLCYYTRFRTYPCLPACLPAARLPACHLSRCHLTFFSKRDLIYCSRTIFFRNVCFDFFLQLDEEKDNAVTSFFRKGFKNRTWWEEDSDIEESSNWRT